MTASPFSLPPCRSLLALRIHHRLHRHTRHRYGRYRPGDPVSLFPARRMDLLSKPIDYVSIKPVRDAGFIRKRRNHGTLLALTKIVFVLHNGSVR